MEFSGLKIIGKSWGNHRKSLENGCFFLGKSINHWENHWKLLDGLMCLPAIKHSNCEIPYKWRFLRNKSTKSTWPILKFPFLLGPAGIVVGVRNTWQIATSMGVSPVDSRIKIQDPVQFHDFWRLNHSSTTAELTGPGGLVFGIPLDSSRGYPAWNSLLARVRDCVPCLEPRGPKG